MKRKGEMYVIDAFLATIIILSVLTIISLSKFSFEQPPFLPPDEELTALLHNLEFLNSVYANDTLSLKVLVESYISSPYNLTIYSLNGDKILSIGEPLEGPAAMAIIPGWNGTLTSVIISLKVRR